ncbi:hypothetical protein [uncultured Hoeflea sp.]|uniref:hypothetical protein n=1 Tax=uncultured Hoeflea sp. TaxID=538666 RepID=UPI0030D8350F|tara:strand:+ start:758 stop:1576 length:819 start_codon:yes stop_codon:yes gene_type:complete
MSWKRLIGQVLTFGALTILTQIGGIVYLASKLATGATGIRRSSATLLVFIILYVAATASANMVAPIFGRVPISCTAHASGTIAVQTPIYCILNRNYVTQSMLDLVSTLAVDVNQQFPGTTTVVLDGNFPFLDGFPLLPHLSHSDGRKLDIAFYYKDTNGEFINQATRSPIGYFAFEQASPGDEQPCMGRRDILTTRWDLDWLQPLFPAYSIEEKRTAFALEWLATEGVRRFALDKVFVEPHVRNALGLTGDAIRFQGCRAARHDDHIHIQVN